MSFEPATRRACLLAGLLLASACADFRRGEYWDEADPTDGAGTGGTAAGSSFATDVYPILVDRCQSCHAPDASAGTTGFLITEDVDATFASTLAFVSVEDGDESRLLRKARGVSHGGGAVLDDTSADYQAIATWITQGAMP